MNNVALRSDHWQLHLAPEHGVGLLAAQANVEGQWLDLMPDCRGSHHTLKEACFQMLPYSNRIRDGQFHFGGQTILLDDAERHAIHGALRKRPWKILRQSEQELICIHDNLTANDINWPWAMHARTGWRLEDDLIHATLLIENRDKHAMPAGLGWHPYFTRSIHGSDPWLELPVHAVYPDSDGDCLPTGAAQPLPDALDFRSLRALDPTQRIDHCFAGLSGIARIVWKAAGIGLSLAASDSCSHCVLFNPDADYFALEPVSNANDGFNLAARGIDAGVSILQPGESLEASFSIELERL